MHCTNIIIQKLKLSRGFKKYLTTVLSCGFGVSGKKVKTIRAVRAICCCLNLGFEGSRKKQRKDRVWRAL
jgi:hypothetical protein